METTKTKKYPIGMYVTGISFSFERYAFYVAKWLLAIFIAAETVKGGLGLDTATGALMNSFLVAGTYVAPVVGGFIADRWVSPRILIPIGMILMGAGYLCAWQANGIGMMWAMIILVSIGTGFFKGNTNGITGRLFDDPEKLDSAFSIQYSFVNIGSFVGTTLMGVIAVMISYRVCFLICAILLFVDCVWFILAGNKFLGDVGKKPFLVEERGVAKKEKKVAVEHTEPLTTVEKQRMTAIIICTAFSIIFWLVWYLAYLPVYYHFGPVSESGLGNANWMLGSFEIPSAWFDSMNALGCIIMGPILASFWGRMARRPKGDINMFKKTALGMIFLGGSIGLMVLADIARGDGQASILWIVAVAITLTLGEMVFSPLGNSFISKFAPPRFLGTLLGVWPLAIFFVGLTYGFLYNFLDKFPFATAYGIVAGVVLACGLVLWVLANKFNLLVHEDEK